jgi:uncharacterized protein
MFNKHHQPSLMKNILIAGGSGSIGRHLTDMLKEEGYAVAWLSRKQQPGAYVWSPEVAQIDPMAITWADAIVNLAGAGIADERWTKVRKRELIDSRVRSAQTIKQALLASKKTGIHYLGASAIGYYGNSGDTLVDESAEPADQSFMVECCAAWEQAHEEIGLLGNPLTILRIGVVLDRAHGALAEITKTMRFGMGATFGDGQMYMPWIHHQDLCRMMIWALSQQKLGIYNAVAPSPMTNAAFTGVVRDALYPRALLLPAPAFGLRLALGEMSAVVLNSNRVSAEKVVKTGFSFTYPDLKSALTAL